MQCEFCRSDNTEEAKFCFACGRPLIVEYNIKNVDTDPKCESAQSQEDKPHDEKNGEAALSAGWTEKVFGLIVCILAGLFVYYIIIIPYVIPERIWHEDMKYEARMAVCDYLEENSIMYKEVTFESRKRSHEKFEPDSLFMAIYGTDLGDMDKLYRYRIESTWKVNIDDYTYFNMAAESVIICEPKLFGDFSYFKMTQCREN